MPQLCNRRDSWTNYSPARPFHAMGPIRGQRWAAKLSGVRVGRYGRGCGRYVGWAGQTHTGEVTTELREERSRDWWGRLCVWPDVDWPVVRAGEWHGATGMRGRPGRGDAAVGLLARSSSTVRVGWWGGVAVRLAGCRLAGGQSGRVARGDRDEGATGTRRRGRGTASAAERPGCGGAAARLVGRDARGAGRRHGRAIGRWSRVLLSNRAACLPIVRRACHPAAVWGWCLY